MSDAARSSASLWDLKYPVKNVFANFDLPFVGNDTLTWKGQVAMVVDAEGGVWQTDALVFDTPWYHCSACGERQSFGANFCPKCGKQLDWEHTDERDPAASETFQAEVKAKIEEAMAV